MATAYPGKGVQLWLASSNVREPVWLGPREADPVIPSASSSVGVAVNGGMQTDVNVVFAAAPAGTAFNVMYSTDPTFSDEMVLQAVAATADTTYVWTTNVRLSGFIRITNDGGQDILSAWLQQTAAYFG